MNIKGLIVWPLTLIAVLALTACSGKTHPLKGESKHKVCTEIAHKLTFKNQAGNALNEELPTDRAELMRQYKRFHCDA